LSDSITTALNKTVQVELSGNNAVGSDRLDEIAKTIQQVNDKIISVKNEVDDKIEMLNTSNNKETSSIDRIVANAVNTSILPIKQEINVLRNDIGRVDSTQRQGRTTLEAQLQEIDRRLNLSRNITGSIGVGVGGIYG